MTNIIEVRNVGKSFDYYKSEWHRVLSWFVGDKNIPKHWTLEDISFDVKAGEAIGIVGQNGAGKSTLLKILTGTMKQSVGTVTIKGKVASILELGIGFHPDISGRKNVYNLASLMGHSYKDIDGVIDNIESFADIGEYFDEPVRTYSSGMQARVAFAVATAFRPDILIVDEALSVGDISFQAKCYELISQYKKEGMTLLLVTHSINDIVRHCDRAIFIKQGKLKADGTPKDISNMYLDELFGKGKQDSTNTESKKSDMDLSQIQDVYHTRQGYRKEEYRWGMGGAKILDFLIVSEGEQYPSQISSNAQTDFIIKVLFENSYSDVTVGFLIKTHDGIFLYGTNSYLLSHAKAEINVNEGEVKVFKISLPIKLNQGSYLVSLGVSVGPQDNLEPLDRRYDSIIINIERKMSFWGIADLEAKFEVE